MGEGLAGAGSAAKAGTFYRKACDARDADGCTALGLAYQSGAGVSKDLKQAATAFAIGCQAGTNDACNEMGLAFQRGAGVARDLERARNLFGNACGRFYSGHTGACSNLGRYYEERGEAGDLARAAALYRMACEKARDTDACLRLGGM